MYIDDLMSDDQADDKAKVKVKDEVTEEVKGQHEKVKRSKLRRMRTEGRKRHRKFYSTTTVSDFEIYNEDDFSRYVEVVDREKSRQERFRKLLPKTEDKATDASHIEPNSSNTNASITGTNIETVDKLKNRTNQKRKNRKLKGGERKGQRPNSETIIQQEGGLIKNITSVVTKVVSPQFRYSCLHT